ncbi:MAG TPA: cupredoxin domain-containing protein [Pyrinomonadaceae bacterium]|nr:cupredoxin domain-containing protein [Pyrinomonadaceae bacterium]
MTRFIVAFALVLIVAASAVEHAHGQRSRIQNVTVNLTAQGYNPSVVRLRKGVRARLTFIRKTDETCGQQLLIPAYNITRDLPLNQPVTVKFTPKRNGTFRFTCGMNMLRGKLLVS